MLILAAFLLTVAFALMAMRDSDNFGEMAELSYRWAYGDFEDYPYENHKDRIFFILASIMGPLVLLNLIIAIMGDVYGKIQENYKISDNHEMLSLILELSKFGKLYYRPPPPELKHIHWRSVLIYKEKKEEEKIEKDVKKVQEGIDELGSKLDDIVDVHSSEIEALNRKIDTIEEIRSGEVQDLNTKMDAMTQKMEQLLSMINA